MPPVSLPQFLEEKAKSLNKAAYKIHPSLFFFCNYEYTHLPTFTSYDRFVQAIQELYKFTIDCCPLHNIFSVLHPTNNQIHTNALFSQLSKLPEESRKQYDDTHHRIQILRSVYNHNVSKSNSVQQRTELDEFRDEFVYITGFEYDAANLRSEDFESACSKLLDDAESIVDFIFSFAQQIASLPPCDKASVVQKWQKKILAWYSRGTRLNFFYERIPSHPAFTEFKNYRVKMRGQSFKLPDYIKEIADDIQLLIDSLGEETEKVEALCHYKQLYEDSELPEELAASTPEDAKERLESVHKQLMTICTSCPDRNYGEKFLELNSQTAFFEATQKLYPSCSLLPQEFYDYVIYKLLRL